MMNWSEYEDAPPKRKTVLPYWSLILAASLGLAVAGALWAGKVYGA